MKSFPFDSVVTYDSSGVPSFDRAVNSEILAGYFHLLYTDGVFPVPGTNLQVTASAQDMSVVVKPGNVNIQGRLGIEETERTLVFEAAGTVYDRIDAVVARLNTNYDYRKIDLYVVKGIEASVPVAPELTRSGGVYELRLANVFIAKNTTVISSERITDTRLVTSDCGIVTPNPEKLDTEPLFEQFQAELESFKAGTEKDILEWFESIKEKLDEDPAANLQNQIGNIEELKTDEKRNLVNAVNEVHELAENVGSDYDSSISYQVGDYCLQKNVLYRCITATAGTAEALEEFDADKWERVEVAGELSKQNERLDDLESSIITTDKTLTGSKAGMMKVNKVLGKSEQASTSGKNLYNLEDKTGSWVGATVDDEGWITVSIDNSTGTSNTYVNPNLRPCKLLQPNKEYLIVTEIKTCTLSQIEVCSSSTANNTGQIYGTVYYNTNGIYVAKRVTREDFTDCITMLRTVVRADPGVSGTAVFRISVLEDTSITEDTFVYEPYTGGQPSPNPDYPQEIKSVVVSGVKTHGENLLDLRNGSSKSNADGVAYTNRGDGSYSRIGTATGGNGNAWFFGGYKNVPEENGSNVLLTLKAGHTYYLADCLLYSVNTDGTLVAKVPGVFTADTDFKVTGVRNSGQTSGTSYNDVVYPRLFEATEDLGWKPYTESVIELSEPVTLHGIGDVMDELTPDGVVRKILKETVTLEKGTVSTNTTRYNGLLSKMVKGKYVSGYCSICHKYAFNGDDYAHFYCDQNSDGVRLFLDNSILAQPTEADVAMVLSEEYNEPIPKVDQIALRSLKTFDGVTYITVDSSVEPEVEVEYATNNTGANILDASATSEKNTIQLGGLSFGIDGEGNYGYFKADDSFVPFKSGGEFFLNPSVIPSEHFILVIQKTAYGGLEKVNCSVFQYLITNCTVSNVIHEFAENTFADAGEYKGVVSWCYILECTATKEQVGQSLSVTVTHSSGWDGTQIYTDNTVFAVTL